MAKQKMPVAKTPIPVKIVSEPASAPNKIDADREKKWRAEDDLRTIKAMAELQRDKERMRNAKSLAKQQMADLKKCLK